MTWRVASAIAAATLDGPRRARNPSPMDAIAERTLDFLETGSDQPQRIRVVLGKPVQIAFIDAEGAETGAHAELIPGEPIPEGACWSAPYGIYGPGEESLEQNAFGEDSLQALVLALRILPVLLHTIYAPRGVLICDGGAWDMGFAQSDSD